MAELRQLLRKVLERIKGSNRAEERDRGVERLMNDIEVLKREAEWYRRLAARQLGRQ